MRSPFFFLRKNPERLAREGENVARSRTLVAYAPSRSVSLSLSLSLTLSLSRPRSFPLARSLSVIANG